MSSRYMKIKEDSRFQRRKIEDDTKNCPAGGEDGKANVIYLLLSSSVFFYLRRKWNFRNLSKIKSFPPRYKTSSGTIRNSERRAIKLFSRLENIFSRFGYLFSRLDYIFSSLENNFVTRLKTKVKGASWFS